MPRFGGVPGAFWLGLTALVPQAHRGSKVVQWWGCAALSALCAVPEAAGEVMYGLRGGNSEVLNLALRGEGVGGVTGDGGYEGGER